MTALFFQLVIAIAAGFLGGLFTGLLPGIHINLVALLLFSASGMLLQYFSPLTLVVFIVAMTITHSFLDFIPGIFLGAPNADTALSVLPGHTLLMEGRGYGASQLTAFGCYLGVLLLVLFTPFFILILPPLYTHAAQYMAFILIAASLFLFLHEKNKFMAVILFLLSGILGIASLHLPVKEPLFPLLTGLFGTSMLVKSISDNTNVPPQKKEKLNVDKRELKRIIPAGILASSLCSFLPGLGAAQAAVIGSEASGKISRKGFLILLGMISILVAGLNFMAIYAIGKPRSGTAVIAAQILQDMSLQHVMMLLAAMVIAGSASYFLALSCAGIFAQHIGKISYQKISAVILMLLTGMSFFFSGMIGLAILITATAIGLTAHYANVRKMHLMGCLMIPVILYFL